MSHSICFVLKQIFSMCERFHSTAFVCSGIYRIQSPQCILHFLHYVVHISVSFDILFIEKHRDRFLQTPTEILTRSSKQRIFPLLDWVQWYLWFLVVLGSCFTIDRASISRDTQIALVKDWRVSQRKLWRQSGLICFSSRRLVLPYHWFLKSIDTGISDLKCHGGNGEEIND